MSALCGVSSATLTESRTNVVVVNHSRSLAIPKNKCVRRRFGLHRQAYHYANPIAENQAENVEVPQNQGANLLQRETPCICSISILNKFNGVLKLCFVGLLISTNRIDVRSTPSHNCCQECLSPIRSKTASCPSENQRCPQLDEREQSTGMVAWLLSMRFRFGEK